MRCIYLQKNKYKLRRVYTEHTRLWGLNNLLHMHIVLKI